MSTTRALLLAALCAPAPAAAQAPSPSPSPAPQVAQSPAPLPGRQVALPLKPGSVRFAVIGDTGTGTKSQLMVAERLVESRKRFPYDFVIMVGDNVYGSETPRDLEKKFEQPYAPLLQAGVRFYASLGNHDDPNQRFYKHFNMNGERYYTFKPADGVRFFALDSNYMGKEQLAWLEKELAASGSDWKVAFFHHPLYSSGGKHGSDVELREILEPVFVAHGVDVVFTGHEHFYERLHPQKGIFYFISGAAAKLRKGDVRPGSPLTAKAFDDNYHFMLVEIAGDEMYFQTVTAGSEVVDSGIVKRPRRGRQAEREPSPRPAAASR